MSKERLEEVKEIIKHNYPPVNYSLLRDALDWLIEQAERVEELENEYQVRQIEYLEEHIDRLEKENKRYREALEWYSENSPHGNIADEALEGEE